jgi:hypothetical protein
MNNNPYELKLLVHVILAPRPKVLSSNRQRFKPNRRRLGFNRRRFVSNR